jgi:hypothetical protein
MTTGDESAEAELTEIGRAFGAKLDEQAERIGTLRGVILGASDILRAELGSPYRSWSLAERVVLVLEILDMAGARPDP